MASSTAMACFAPAPMGTACRRTSSGESTTSTSGSSRCSSSAFQVPWSSSVSPAASTVSFGPVVLTSALHGQDDEIAARGDHPGEHRLADHAGPGRDDDLGQTGRAVEQRVRDVGGGDRPTGRRGPCRRPAPRGRLRVATHDEDVALGERGRRSGPAVAGLDGDQGQARVLRQVDGRRRRPDVRRCRRAPGAGTARRRAGTARSSVRACLLRSAGIDRPLAVAAAGACRTAPRSPWCRGAAAPRRGRTRRSRTAPTPASTAASDTSTFTGVPVSASSDPACAGEHQRHEQLRRRAAEPDRHARRRRAGGRRTAPLTLISAVRTPTSSMMRTSSRVAALVRLRDQELPGPRRHAGGVEARADHEQRRDEDHRRVAEAGERLAEIEDARGPERERRRRGPRSPPGSGPRRRAPRPRRRSRR